MCKSSSSSQPSMSAFGHDQSQKKRQFEMSFFYLCSFKIPLAGDRLRLVIFGKLYKPLNFRLLNQRVSLETFWDPHYREIFNIS